MPTLTKQRQVDLYEFPVNLSPQSRASQGNKVREERREGEYFL